MIFDHVMKYNAGNLVKNLKYISFFISVSAILAIIFEYGFDLDEALLVVLRVVHISAIISETISVISRYIFRKKFPVIQIWLAELFLVAFPGSLLAGLTGMQSMSFFDSWILLYFGIFIVFIREFSEIDPVAYANRGDQNNVVYKFFQQFFQWKIILWKPVNAQGFYQIRQG